MVLTRSQRTPQVVLKSDRNKSHAGSGSDPDCTVQKTETSKKSRRAKSAIAKSKSTPIPAKSNVNDPLPDSTTPPGSRKLVEDKDAVVDMATNDVVITKSGDLGEPAKGKRSRRKNRKRKLTVENEGETGDSSEIGETAQPSISSSVPDRASQQKTTKEDDRQDQCRENLEPASKTSVMNQLQKENVNTTEEEAGSAEEEGLDLAVQIQPVDAKKVLHLYKKESYIEGQAAKPKGKPKSGRHWKTEQTTRFSGMKQDNPLKSSWQKKMQQKADMKNMKTFEAELKEARSDEQERKKKQRAKKIKRKLENQRKSEIVQMISNPAKIKRMKKKELRKIEMRSMPDSSKKQVFAS